MSEKEIQLLQECINIPQTINLDHVVFEYAGCFAEVNSIITIAKKVGVDTEPLCEESSNPKLLYEAKITLTRGQFEKFWIEFKNNFKYGS